jgi:hypothetical protein
MPRLYPGPVARPAHNTPYFEGNVMTAELRALIEQNRGRQLSPQQLDAKVRSFAYGNLAIEEPSTSRAAVDAAADALNLERQRVLGSVR